MRKCIVTAACIAAMTGSAWAADSNSEFTKVYQNGTDGVYSVEPVQRSIDELTGLTELTDAEYEQFSSIPGFMPRSMLMARSMEATSTTPSRVDNSEEIYFRPIFSQSGGSCGQASGIGYAFTYEMNLARNTDASIAANQYPTHYTWNHLNGGTGGGSWYYDGWQIIKDNGCPTVETWGGMAGDYTRWLSGYDNYLAGMKNMVTSYERINNVNTPAGLEVLKRWLHDGGDGSPVGGIACFAAWIYGTDYVDLPTGTPDAGKQMVTQWGDGGYHAMTIVGYDDSVRYDFNGDGQFTNDIDINGDNKVDMSDWEIGALKFANSWGVGYGDDGFSYMAYKAIADKDKRGGNALTSNCTQIVRVKAENDPKAVLKVEMEHSRRNALQLIASVEQNGRVLTKTFPQSFNYWKGGEHPMQGRNNTAPIELGLDVTSLFEGIDANSPATFALNVYERDGAGTADGTVLGLSLMDYSEGEAKEFVSQQSNVTLNNNNVTVVSVTRDTGDVTPTGDLRIQYLTNHTTTDTKQIFPYIRIYNEGTDSLNLAEVTAEYYYTFEGSATCELSQVNWATIQPNNYSDITAKANVRTLENGDQRVLQFWFYQDAGYIQPGGYVDVYSFARKCDWTDYDQSNDYSFGAISSYQDWTKIVGKINGVKVWGVGPNEN